VQGALAGSAARIAGGIGIVACAAVVAFAVGGGGVFGGLGSLFGRNGQSLEVAKAVSPRADIVAAPTAAERTAAVPALANPAPRRPTSNRRRRSGSALPPRASNPAPAPSRPLPGQPPVLPPPAPGGGQTVGAAGETVKQVADQAPPPLHPVMQPVGGAVDTVVQTCRGLPVCP
jgi:hypothetical protein